jgi:hypothetical protein
MNWTVLQQAASRLGARPAPFACVDPGPAGYPSRSVPTPLLMPASDGRLDVIDQGRKEHLCYSSH